MTTPGIRSTAVPQWLQHKERGSLAALRAMSALSLMLGRRATRPVLPLVALYFMLTDSEARQASRDYLGRALGRPARWTDVWRHVLTFAHTIHDRLYLLNERHALFDVHVSGGEALHQVQHAGEGCLLFGAHFGSFEVLRTLARNHPRLRLSIAMYAENARRIQSVLAAINPRAAQDVIALGQIDAMLVVRERIAGGAMVGLLADRASGPDEYVSLPFLGRPAQFPSGPFRLAALLGGPVFFMTGAHCGGNRYAVEFVPLGEMPVGAGPEVRQQALHALMRRYVEELERQCRASPYNWFNFFDFWQEH